jgi:hypothetical protein
MEYAAPRRLEYNLSVRLRLIRLLAFLVALFVPLQGMAVVVAGQCMVFGHHEATTGHDDHGQAAHGQDGHDHASHSHADDTASAAQSDEGDDNSAHCGPCTACCASASIAGPAGVSILSSPSNAKYVFWQFSPIGVQPHGLDRPPLAL